MEHWGFLKQEAFPIAICKDSWQNDKNPCTRLLYPLLFVCFLVSVTFADFPFLTGV